MSSSTILGWAGTLLILSAYFLVSSGRVKSNSGTYQIMNLVGAVFVGVNVLTQEAWPAFGLQVAWFGVALYGLYKGRQR